MSRTPEQEQAQAAERVEGVNVEGSGGPGMQLSDEDRRILDAFHALPMRPKVENPGDLMSFMNLLGKLSVKEEELETSVRERHDEEAHKHNYHYPKLSAFFGEPNKGDVSWPSFKFEVDSLIADKVYSEDQILYGIRRALRGKASDQLRRAGTGLSLQDAIRKLESEFGSIDTEESAMEKFYSMIQKPKEDVACNLCC